MGAQIAGGFVNGAKCGDDTKDWRLMVHQWVIKLEWHTSAWAELRLTPNIVVIKDYVLIIMTSQIIRPVCDVGTTIPKTSFQILPEERYSIL